MPQDASIDPLLFTPYLDAPQDDMDSAFLVDANAYKERAGEESDAIPLGVVAGDDLAVKDFPVKVSTAIPHTKGDTSSVPVIPQQGMDRPTMDMISDVDDFFSSTFLSSPGADSSLPLENMSTPSGVLSKNPPNSDAPPLPAALPSISPSPESAASVPAASQLTQEPPKRLFAEEDEQDVYRQQLRPEIRSFFDITQGLQTDPRPNDEPSQKAAAGEQAVQPLAPEPPIPAQTDDLRRDPPGRAGTSDERSISQITGESPPIVASPPIQQGAFVNEPPTVSGEKTNISFVAESETAKVGEEVKAPLSREQAEEFGLPAAQSTTLPSPENISINQVPISAEPTKQADPQQASISRVPTDAMQPSGSLPPYGVSKAAAPPTMDQDPEPIEARPNSPAALREDAALTESLQQYPVEPDVMSPVSSAMETASESVNQRERPLLDMSTPSVSENQFPAESPGDASLPPAQEAGQGPPSSHSLPDLSENHIPTLVNEYLVENHEQVIKEMAEVGPTILQMMSTPASAPDTFQSRVREHGAPTPDLVMSGLSDLSTTSSSFEKQASQPAAAIMPPSTAAPSASPFSASLPPVNEPTADSSAAYRFPEQQRSPSSPSAADQVIVLSSGEEMRGAVANEVTNIINNNAVNHDLLRQFNEMISEQMSKTTKTLQERIDSVCRKVTDDAINALLEDLR